VLKVEDWAEIRRLHRAEGMPIKAIARQLEIGRNTVRRALAADGPPCYQRPAKGSIVDEVGPRIRELLARCGLRGDMLSYSSNQLSSVHR
jgi:transposase